MRKKVFRIFAIILLAMLARHFYQKSEIPQTELPTITKQINIEEKYKEDNIFNWNLNEFVGTEHLSVCEFWCKVGYESTVHPNVVSREIYRFTSLDLGITFLYEASFTSSERGDSNKATIIQYENLVCLRNSNEKGLINKIWCIEFFPQEERENIAKQRHRYKQIDDEVFGTWTIFNTTSDTEDPIYDTNAFRHHIPNTNLYFVQYSCEWCAPWPDFTWINTIETV